MNKITMTLIASITFLLGGMAAVTLVAAPINPANYTAPVRIACVGDSITQGVGAVKGKSYPSQLQALLGDKWLVRNFGVSGRTLLKKGDFPYWKEKVLQGRAGFSTGRGRHHARDQ